jgi:hypothetical protein
MSQSPSTVWLGTAATTSEPLLPHLTSQNRAMANTCRTHHIQKEETSSVLSLTLSPLRDG